MIDYSKEQWGGTLHLIGSVLPRSIPQALISVAVVFAVVAYARFVENTFARTEVQTPIGAVGDEVIYEFAEHPYVHQMGMLSISFVIAFRVNLAYNRYWEGLTMVHSMRSKWVDAITQLLAFDDPISLGPHPENTTGFKVMIAHLFSLLHAVAMLEIKGVWDVRCLISRRPEQLATPVTLMTMMFPWLRTFYMHEENRHRYIQMEVLGGVDERALDQLLSIGDHGWVEFVHARIIRVICDRMTSGGLNFPPPIISRIFQEISTGTLMSASAQKIAQVPFPWPFFDVMRLIKYYFLLTGPLVIVSFTTHVSVAVFLSFLSSLFFVAINEVAEELEDPFGEDANDLPLNDLHKEFNEILYKMIFMPRLETDVLSSAKGRNFQAHLKDSMVRRFGKASESTRRFRSYLVGGSNERSLHGVVQSSDLALEIPRGESSITPADQRAQHAPADGSAARRGSWLRTMFVSGRPRAGSDSSAPPGPPSPRSGASSHHKRARNSQGDTRSPRIAVRT